MRSPSFASTLPVGIPINPLYLFFAQINPFPLYLERNVIRMEANHSRQGPPCIGHPEIRLAGEPEASQSSTTLGRPSDRFPHAIRTVRSRSRLISAAESS